MNECVVTSTAAAAAAAAAVITKRTILERTNLTSYECTMNDSNSNSSNNKSNNFRSSCASSVSTESSYCSIESTGNLFGDDDPSRDDNDSCKTSDVDVDIDDDDDDDESSYHEDDAPVDDCDAISSTSSNNKSIVPEESNTFVNQSCWETSMRSIGSTNGTAGGNRNRDPAASAISQFIDGNSHISNLLSNSQRSTSQGEQPRNHETLLNNNIRNHPPVGLLVLPVVSTATVATAGGGSPNGKMTMNSYHHSWDADAPPRQHHTSPFRERLLYRNKMDHHHLWKNKTTTSASALSDTIFYNKMVSALNAEINNNLVVVSGSSPARQLPSVNNIPLREGGSSFFANMAACADHGADSSLTIDLFRPVGLSGFETNSSRTTPTTTTTTFTAPKVTTNKETTGRKPARRRSRSLDMIPTHPRAAARDKESPPRGITRSPPWCQGGKPPMVFNSNNSMAPNRRSPPLREGRHSSNVFHQASTVQKTTSSGESSRGGSPRGRRSRSSDLIPTHPRTASAAFKISSPIDHLMNRSFGSEDAVKSLRPSLDLAPNHPRSSSRSPPLREGRNSSHLFQKMSVPRATNETNGGSLSGRRSRSLDLIPTHPRGVARGKNLEYLSPMNDKFGTDDAVKKSSRNLAHGMSSSLADGRFGLDLPLAGSYHRRPLLDSIPTHPRAHNNTRSDSGRRQMDYEEPRLLSDVFVDDISEISSLSFEDLSGFAKEDATGSRIGGALGAQ